MSFYKVHKKVHTFYCTTEYSYCILSNHAGLQPRLESQKLPVCLINLFELQFRCLHIYSMKFNPCGFPAPVKLPRLTGRILFSKVTASASVPACAEWRVPRAVCVSVRISHYTIHTVVHLEARDFISQRLDLVSMDQRSCCLSFRMYRRCDVARLPVDLR